MGRPSSRPAAVATGPSRVAQRWSPKGRSYGYGVRQTGLIEGEAGVVADQGPLSPEVIPTPDAMGPDSSPGQARMFAPQIGEPEGVPWGPEPYGASDGPCGECGGSCDEQCSPWGDGARGCLVDWLCNFTFFAGIQGFRGPVDVGQNGNFGFHEGLNFGAPLGDPWGLGYQLGAAAVHSDLSGFQINTTGANQSGVSSRQQIFFTGGIFRRTECGGFQGGVVFDYVHDSYYDKADLKQIRSESSFVFANGVSELGYWGAYGINRQRFQVDSTNPASLLTFQPNDVFAGFYRRHFSGGGQGRLWIGGTGAGQAIIGGEATVPLGTSWAIENSFAYVIPKTSATNGGLREETWSATINLVWYPGRPARTVFRDPFQPLFGVGDNSAFLVRRGAN
jgi:hypothetical protein